MADTRVEGGSRPSRCAAKLCGCPQSCVTPRAGVDVIARTVRDSVTASCRGRVKKFFSRVPLIPDSTDFIALAQRAHTSPSPPSVGPLVPLAPLWCDSRPTRSAQEPGTDGRAAKLLNPPARQLKGRPHGVLPKSGPSSLHAHARQPVAVPTPGVEPGTS